MVSLKKTVSKCNVSPSKSSSKVSSTNSNASTASTSKTRCSSQSKSGSRPISRTSVKSTDSVVSVGIGVPPNAGTTVGKLTALEHKLRFRLMPEGLGTNVFNVYDQVAYDCLVAVVSCERHGTVALTAPTDWTRMYSYFPFIPLQETFTWKRMSRDLLALVLKSDAVGDEDLDQAPVALPDYTTTWLGINRLQLSSSTSSSSTKFTFRLLQHAQLLTPAAAEGTISSAKCCIDNSRIRWVKMADIVAGGGCDNLWSDEVVALCRLLTGLDARADFVAEIDGRVAMPTAAEDLALLRSINWNEKLVAELLEDYVRHMFPAVTMSLHSLAAFLEKYSLVGKKDKRVGRLYKAFIAGGDALGFSQLLVGLAAMDPETTNDQEMRAKFIFNYYDTEGKGVLTVAQVKEMCREVTSVNPSRSKIQNLIKAFSGGTGTLNLAQFTEALRSENISPKADGFLRFEKSFFEAKKTSRRHSSRSNSDSGNSERQSLGKKSVSKGSSASNNKSIKSNQSKTSADGCCFAHSSKRYEFGLHTVTLDSTGRCVDPRIIDDHWVTKWGSKEMTRNRFSVENVFRHNSTANIFIDLVRDFKEKQVDQPDCPGMLTAEEDLNTLYSYLDTLARQASAVFRSEAKLLRLGGFETGGNSIFVVGDLQGGLRDLLHIESILFRSAPVSGNSMLFLGNYTGPYYSYGFEVVLYLFALKVAMPNRFYLLRGKNEIRAFNGVHLKGELVHKFGDDMGEKIWELFNSAFDCMPMAAVLNESILCTHSGIPNLPLGKKSSLVTTFQAKIANFAASGKTDFADPRSEIPIGYEMMVNIPVRYAHTDQEKAATKEKGFGASTNGAYHYFSSKMFDNFMTANGFQFHLRSHNPAEEGYALCFNNRNLTVYSCRRFNTDTLPFISVLQVGASPAGNTGYSKIRVIRFPTAEMTTSKKKSTSKSH